jgi:centrosomal protein CEP290
MRTSMAMFPTGKLHRHIVQLQVSEGLAVRKLEDARKQVSRLEAQLLRTDQKVDQKDQTLYHNRLESHSKIKHLKSTVQVGYS